MRSPIFLIGYMASGKSSIGRKVAKAWDMNFIDLDKAIEEIEDCSINQIFSEKGEDYFRQAEKKILQSLDVENSIIAVGGGTPCFFDNMATMQSKGRVVYLEVPLKILIGRLRQQKASRPLVKDMDEHELSVFVRDSLAQRELIYRKADNVVDGTQSIGQLKQQIGSIL